MKKSSHEILIDKAKDAINKVFNDITVTKDTVKESLKELKDEIVILMDTL